MDKKMFEPVYKNEFMSVEKHLPTGFTIVRSSDAIAVFILVKNRGVLLIKQSRPAMISEENPTGELIEAIAGRFDVNLSPTELAIKEVKEEVGGHIKEGQIMFLNNGIPLAVSAGINTEKIYLFYAEVEEGQIEKDERIFGHAAEGEQITRLFVPIHELKNMVFHDMKTFALVQWFLHEYETGRFLQ